MKKEKVAPATVQPIPIETVTLLGGGLKGSSSPPRIFPGDLIAYRAEKPYEWKPWFGVVVSPHNEVAKYFDTAEKEGPVTVGAKSKGTLKGKASTFTAASRKASASPTVATVEASAVLPVETPRQHINIPEDGIPGTVWVNWAHSRRIGSLEDRKEVAVVDRNLMKGQRVKNADGLCGTVVDSSEKVTIQVLSTEHVIDSVNVHRLLPVTNFFRGREILYDGWIGIITTVRRLLNCRLDNSGAYFQLKTNETDGFLKPDPYWGLGMPCAGLPTKYAPATMKKAVFRGPFMRFIHRWVPPVSYFYTRSSAKTIGVETISLDVMWLERCPNIPEAPEIQPPSTLQKENLLKIRGLGLPNYETLGLNSVRMFGIKEEDAIVSHGNWYAGFQAKFFGTPDTSYSNLATVPSTLTSVLKDGYQVPVKIIFRQTEVEVEWDDGHSEHLLAAKIPKVLCPQTSSEYETGVVVESVRGDNDKKYGIVLTRKESESNTVRVRWIQPDQSSDEHDVEIASVMESVDDIKVHTMVSTYSRGNIVFLKDHPQGYKVGTVTGLDLKRGKVLVVVPEVVEPISVYAHRLQPLSKRTYWDFSKREWVQKPVPLPSGLQPKPAEPSEAETDIDTDAEEDQVEPYISRTGETGSNEAILGKPGVLSKKTQKAGLESIQEVTEVEKRAETMEEEIVRETKELAGFVETALPEYLAEETKDDAETNATVSDASIESVEDDAADAIEAITGQFIPGPAQEVVVGAVSAELITNQVEPEISQKSLDSDSFSENEAETVSEKVKFEELSSGRTDDTVVEESPENEKYEVSFPDETAAEETKTQELDTILSMLKKIDEQHEKAENVGSISEEIEAEKQDVIGSEASTSEITTETKIPEESENVPDVSIPFVTEIPLDGESKSKFDSQLEMQAKDSRVAESEVSLEPEVAELLKLQTAAIEVPEVVVADVLLKEPAELLKPEVAELLKPEVAEMLKPEVAELLKPEVAEMLKPEVAEMPKPQVAELLKPEVAEILAEDADTPRSQVISDFNLLGDFESDSGADGPSDEPTPASGPSVSSILPEPGNANKENEVVPEGKPVEVD